MNNCPICFESLNMFSTLPCGHAFHKSCIETWFNHATINLVCPMCKQDLLN